MIKLGEKKPSNYTTVTRQWSNPCKLFSLRLLATEGQRNNSNQGQGIIEIVFNRTDGN